MVRDQANATKYMSRNMAISAFAMGFFFYEFTQLAKQEEEMAQKYLGHLDMMQLRQLCGEN